MCGVVRSLTCIVCPNGCELEVRMDNGQIQSVAGAICPKGEAYARQEMIDPQRTIASSVRVHRGTLPLVSVRLNRPVPKDRLFDVMNELKKVELDAPVESGTCVIHNVLGLNSDVVTTKKVSLAAESIGRQ